MAYTFGRSSTLDNFNRGDSDPLTGNWALLRNNPLQIVSGAATGDQATAGCVSYFSLAQYGPDVEAFVTLSTKSTQAFGDVQIGLRGQLNISGYDFVVTNVAAGNDQIKIRRINNNVFTTLGSVLNQEFSDGDGLGFSAIGNTLTGWRRAAGATAWTQLIQRTDDTFLNTGYLFLGCDGNTPRLTAFSGGQVNTSTVVFIGGRPILL